MVQLLKPAHAQVPHQDLLPDGVLLQGTHPDIPNLHEISLLVSIGWDLPVRRIKIGNSTHARRFLTVLQGYTLTRRSHQPAEGVSHPMNPLRPGISCGIVHGDPLLALPRQEQPQRGTMPDNFSQPLHTQGSHRIVQNLCGRSVQIQAQLVVKRFSSFTKYRLLSWVKGERSKFPCNPIL